MRHVRDAGVKAFEGLFVGGVGMAERGYDAGINEAANQLQAAGQLWCDCHHFEAAFCYVDDFVENLLGCRT